MSKREKILVAASFAAFLWGVMILVDKLEEQAAVKPPPVEDISAFVGKVSETVNNDPSGGLNDMILSKARRPWGRDPFYSSGPLSFDSKEDLHYQGYVKTRGRIFALINNIEYKMGEDVQGKDLKIKMITPDRVVLVTPERKKRILPIEGDR